MSALDSLHGALVKSFEAGEPLLTMRELTILLHLRLRRDLSTCELSDALSVPKPAITRAVDALETIGLVHRKRNPDDMRFVRMTLSESGRLYLERFERRFTPVSTKAAA